MCLEILIQSLFPTWGVFNFYSWCQWWPKQFINNILFLFLCIFLCLIEDDRRCLPSFWCNRHIFTLNPRCYTCTRKVFMSRIALVAEHIATSWCYATVHGWRRQLNIDTIILFTVSPMFLFNFIHIRCDPMLIFRILLITTYLAYRPVPLF